MKVIKTDELERARERKKRSLAKNQKPSKVVTAKQPEKRKRKQRTSTSYVGIVLAKMTAEKIFSAGMPDPRQRKRKARKLRSNERIANSIRMEKL